jgi:heme oxygenase
MTISALSAVEDTAPPSLPPRSVRLALRDATQPAHTRLHAHPALGAVQAGTIDRTSYRALLSRLYGFHSAFEAAAHIVPERSLWLIADLTTLGVEDQAVAALPRCQDLPGLETPHRKLGALYVVEGSTLGGRELAKRLDHLFGPGERDGRHFFSGREADSGRAWRAFTDRLDDAAEQTSARTEMIAAAVETFAAFERWMRDWRGAGNDTF